MGTVVCPPSNDPLVASRSGEAEQGRNGPSLWYVTAVRRRDRGSFLLVFIAQASQKC